MPVAGRGLDGRSLSVLASPPGSSGKTVGAEDIPPPLGSCNQVTREGCRAFGILCLNLRAWRCCAE